MTDRSRFEDWQGYYFGFWGTAGSEPKLDLERWIDRNWDPNDLVEILNYLNEVPTALATFAGYDTCLLCKHDNLPLGSFQYDGSWLWPSSLTHYVEQHRVRLPNRLVKRIRDYDYRSPKSASIGIDLSELPWPPEIRNLQASADNSPDS